MDEIPAPPDYFDKRHSEKYYEVANLIKGMGVLTATDIDAVVSYTEIFVARETAYKNYLKTKDHKDWIKYRDAFTAQKRLQDDIGFNPRARMSMKVEKIKDDNDPMAELLKNLNN